MESPSFAFFWLPMASATKVFGVPLAVIMERPNERTIPTFIKNIIRYLNAHGRCSGRCLG